MSKIAVVQSSFLPWRGYFHLIRTVDKFVFYESAQYTRRDWRNRNKIKTKDGVSWITVPVRSKGNYDMKISEVKFSDQPWQRKLLNSIQHAYKKSPYFDDLYPLILEVILDKNISGLSELNIKLVKSISSYLRFDTEFIIDSELIREDFYELGKSEKLIYFCRETSSKHYYSGPLAKTYMEDSAFKNAGIELTYFKYSLAKEYPQRWGKFKENLSILDLLFNLGEDTVDFL